MPAAIVTIALAVVLGADMVSPEPAVQNSSGANAGDAQAGDAQSSQPPPRIAPPDVSQQPETVPSVSLQPPGGASPTVSLQIQHDGTFTLRRASVVHEGQLFVVELSAGASCQTAPTLAWMGNAFKSFAVKDGWHHGLLPISVNTKPGVQKLQVECGAHKGAFEVPITAGEYPESRLSVDPKFTTAPPHRVVAERLAIEAALGKSEASRLWTQPFVKPGAGVETSPFGVRRTYNGQLKGRHLGEDFDGKTGEALWAANDGVVALAAQDFFYVGNAVFIDHGERFYTMYFHMTQLRVKTGERVVRGQIIGNLGATGRVTGPHVHFGVKLAGTYVNPADLLAYNPASLLEDAAKMIVSDHSTDR